MKELDTVKLIFGLKVHYLRQQQGLSYQQLSEITGLAISYLHNIEKGKKYPKADKIITDMGVLYGEEARKDLARLQAAVDALDAHRDPGGDRLKAVMRVALDLKGQGASFGYHLITAVGAELCRFIDRIGALGDREMEGIRLHLDTLKLVLAKDLRGDGGEAGRELVDGLRRMVDKLSAGG